MPSNTTSVAPTRERAVGDVGVAGDPADVGGAPEDVVVLEVEGPLHRQRGLQQVAAGRVLHALGLAGRARGVEEEQRMLGADPFGLAGRRLALRPARASRRRAALERDVRAAGAPVDDDVADRFAAAQAERLVDDGLQRQRLAAAHLLVGGDHHHRAGVDDAVAAGSAPRSRRTPPSAWRRCARRPASRPRPRPTSACR